VASRMACNRPVATADRDSDDDEDCNDENDDDKNEDSLDRLALNELSRRIPRTLPARLMAG
jgi:hypothetical protein